MDGVTLLREQGHELLELSWTFILFVNRTSVYFDKQLSNVVVVPFMGQRNNKSTTGDKSIKTFALMLWSIGRVNI